MTSVVVSDIVLLLMIVKIMFLTLMMTMTFVNSFMLLLSIPSVFC